MLSCCKFLFSCCLVLMSVFCFVKLAIVFWRKKCVIVTINRIIEDLFEEFSIFKGFVKNLVFFHTI